MTLEQQYLDSFKIVKSNKNGTYNLHTNYFGVRRTRTYEDVCRYLKNMNILNSTYPQLPPYLTTAKQMIENKQTGQVTPK
jgi:ABC-type arginine transport system ATPase subunit